MPNSVPMPVTVLPGNDSENKLPDTPHDPGIDEAGDAYGPKNSDAPEGSGSLIPKLFPVYAFI